MFKELQDIALLLISNQIPFKFDISSIILGETDTGYYGVKENKIKWNYYNDNRYIVENCFKGFPQVDSFYTAEDVLEFIKKGL